MTIDEFEKLESIKKEIEYLKEILNNPLDISDDPGDRQIRSLNIATSPKLIYSSGCNYDKTVWISRELSNDIFHVVKERLKKLRIEFKNIKIE